jgi:hypothetical protein
MSDWRDQEVRNEARSRDRNEWIEDVRESMGDEVATEMYVCECGDLACAEHIKLTRVGVRGGARLLDALRHRGRP